MDQFAQGICDGCSFTLDRHPDMPVKLAHMRALCLMEEMADEINASRCKKERERVTGQNSRNNMRYLFDKATYDNKRRKLIRYSLCFVMFYLFSHFFKLTRAGCHIRRGNWRVQPGAACGVGSCGRPGTGPAAS